MNKIKRFGALKLYWKQVAWYLGNLLSALLGRRITCEASWDDETYWGVKAIDDCFTNAEIVWLVHHVGGNNAMLRDAVPDDSYTTVSLGMDLCEKLLQQVLDLSWEMELIQQDALWIIGDFPENKRIPAPSPDLLFLDSRFIDCNELIGKEHFLGKLLTEGGTFTQLTELCEAYHSQFGTPLYWRYPITDGEHNGCYFVLVKEGVLALPYNEIDHENHEIFLADSIHLCTAEEQDCFLRDWNHFANDLSAALSSMQRFLEEKENVRYAV